MKRTLLELAVLLAAVALLAHNHASVDPRLEDTPRYSPELFSIGGVRLGMSELEARSLLDEVRQDEHSGYRWHLGEAPCNTFYVRDGLVVSVTGTRLEYEGDAILAETDHLVDLSGRFGPCRGRPQDIPGYHYYGFSSLGLTVTTEPTWTWQEKRLCLFTLSPKGSRICYDYWSRRPVELLFPAPYRYRVNLCAGFPDWRQFDEEHQADSPPRAE